MADAEQSLITDRMTQLVLARMPAVGVRGVRSAIGDACGISYEAVRQWYAGDTGNIKNEHLISVALAFDTTLDWLILGAGDPPRRAASDGGLRGTAQDGVAELPVDFGQRLAYFRRRAGLSQAELAAACDWGTQSRIGNYEAGTREPSLGDIEVMAKALGAEAVTLAYGHAATSSQAEPISSRLGLVSSRLDARVVQRARVIVAFDALLGAIEADALPQSSLIDIEKIAAGLPQAPRS